MKTVGEMLKQARAERGISLAAVAAQTKIQVKYLLAVEENEFDKLPAAAFVKGFVRNYARVVGKNPETLLAIFRRDYDQDKRGQIIPRMSVVESQRRWRWTPTLTVVAAVVLVTTVFLVYLVFQLRRLTRPPALEIAIPQESQVFTSTTVEVVGKSDTDAAVTVNDKPVIVSEQGEFKETVLLPSGTHTITVRAAARNGKVKTMQRTITVAQ